MLATDTFTSRSADSAPASVTIDCLAKSFGGVLVIPDLTVSFRAGAISVLLGSSGCGKTTILRCIAGLEEPSGGDIMIYDQRVFSARQQINVPPERRQLGMVFQSYAIWPHMTVHENVALPLRAHGVSNAETQARVQDLLKLVGLDGLGDRNATQLSGGQQQRVAIARCLANQPKLILLDEPLSNLDAKLRVAMRAELRDLQRRLNATMIFVTHDQEEAMSLADEIFLFRSGHLEQHGPGSELYRHPKTRYVAEFFGKANLVNAALHAVEGQHELRASATGDTVAKGVFTQTPEIGRELLCMIRPEAWRIHPPGVGSVQGRIVDVMLLGDRLELQVDTPIGRQYVLALGYAQVADGDDVSLSVASEHVHFLLD